MAYSLVIAGGTLYKLTPAGVPTALALPAGITLSATRPPRWVILGRTVYLTNNPTRSLAIDRHFVVRPMQLIPPVSPVTLARGDAGGLSGAYTVKFTHIIKEPNGALVAESEFSPVSAPATLDGHLLAASNISASQDAAVTHHRLYRTLADGAVYYAWLDVDAQQQTAADDLSDILLPNLAAPRELGTAPGLVPSTYMTQCVEWKNRLWAVGDRDIDTLRFSGDSSAHGWPPTYGLDIKPVGADRYGITGLLARKDLLGVGKRESFWKVSGGLPDDDGVPQWDVQREKDGKGIVGPSLVVDDTGYYLGADGVYRWGPTGFDCVSDGRVRKWFATDEYFNRALFPQAFAKYNERYDVIEWHLARAGSAAIDAWVSYDRASGAWLGPHFTDRTTPTSGFTLVDEGGTHLPAVGGADGHVYLENAPGFADAGLAIRVRLRSKCHDGDAPIIDKVFGAPSIVSRKIDTPGHCQVTYHVGQIEQRPSAEGTLVIGPPPSQVVDVDLRLGTETLPRVGTGQVVQLEITEDTAGIPLELYGYEIPYYELGNRVRR